MINFYKEKQNRNIGGVYIIVNVLDCMAYVGKSNDLTSRTHEADLRNGTDSNTNLQRAVNNGAQVVFFPLATIPKDDDIQPILLDYEKLYMYVVETHGTFGLYNGEQQPKKENRTREAILQLRSIGSDPVTLQDAIDQFDQDFIARFGMTMQELAHASYKEREQVWESYIKNIDKFHAIPCYLNKEAFLAAYPMQEQSIFDLNLDHLIISSAGSYIGDTIKEILAYECESIQAHGYCLWTFGKNKIGTQFGRDFCRRVQAHGKDIYVLFRYTSSDKEANVTGKTVFPFFNKIDFDSISKEEQEFLGVSTTSEGRYSVISGMDTTGKPSASHAFVIQDIRLVKENFDYKDLLKCYYAVVANKTDSCFPMDNNPEHGYLKDAEKVVVGQHDTSCLQRKPNAAIRLLATEDSENTNYFIAKLAAPYIIDLER